MQRRTVLAVGLAAALFMGAIQIAGAAPKTDTTDLRDAVTVEGLMQHEMAFQAIADANGGTRAAGTSGYDESADYVAGLLEGAGYNVTRQVFEYQQFVETADPILDPVSPNLPAYEPGEDFFTMEYSGSGDVTAPIQPVDVVMPPAPTPSSTSGCESSDFAGFTAGNIALVQRGTCTFFDKAANAEAAGASGIIIFNEGQEGRTDALNGTLGGPGVTIPAVGTSFAVGEELYNLYQSEDEVVVRLATFTELRVVQTENVLADTTSGRKDRTVIAGAHLDSVPEGPGIQDNGSGSSTILEIALQMAELDIQPTNRVRFAFWGAEESGLIGSGYYVSQLSKKQIKKIALNLNFDMVASPNYVRFVYDGDGSHTTPAGPNGSAQIEDVFVDYFDSVGLESEPTQFSGRSDYGPFIAVGVPAGGLFTGAEGVKTEEQAAVYGGVADLAYDPCYHQECDDLIEPNEEPALEAAYGPQVLIGNVNTLALDEMSDAAAHAVLTYAMTKSAVQGTDKGSSRSTKTLEYYGDHSQR